MRNLKKYQTKYKPTCDYFFVSYLKVKNGEAYRHDFGVYHDARSAVEAACKLYEKGFAEARVRQQTAAGKIEFDWLKYAADHIAGWGSLGK